MTALFLIMLVLFVLNYQKSQGQIAELRVMAEEKRKLDEIKSSLENLQGRYFVYNDSCKRHEMRVDVVFPARQAELPANKLDSLYLAGKYLQQRIAAIRTDLDVKYLIVVEGRAAKDIYKPANHPDNQDGPSVRALSFRRALALVNYWQSRGLNFNRGRFEIVAAGSGFAGACRRIGRDQETYNRRFVIQILPKVGRIK